MDFSQSSSLFSSTRAGSNLTAAKSRSHAKTELSQTDYRPKPFPSIWVAPSLIY